MWTNGPVSVFWWCHRAAICTVGRYLCRGSMGDVVMLDWWVTLLMMIWRKMTDTGMSDIYIGP